MNVSFVRNCLLQNFKIYFPREVYDQIVNGSLSVEGIEVLSQNSVTKANNLENQTVFIRRAKGDPIECEVVRASDLLLKEKATGRFIRGANHELEYVSIPEEEGQEITFALKQSGNATLSYLINGIQWSPRYNLNVSPDDHGFEAWADMINRTKRDYQIKHTELFGGDVQLRQSTNQFRSFAKRCCIQECCCCCDSSSAPPQIEAQGELAGLYFYSIDQPFVLTQQSTFSLPFVKPILKLDKYSGLTNHFQEQNQKGKLNRMYRIESDRFLPKGSITIREDGRVVGQTEFNDLSQGETQDLDAGNDPDVSFVRQVQILSQQRQSASYLVNLTISNAKSKSIKFQYKEIISSAKFTLINTNQDEQLDNFFKTNAQDFTIQNDNLQSNQQQTFSFEIALEYRDNNNCPSQY